VQHGRHEHLAYRSVTTRLRSGRACHAAHAGRMAILPRIDSRGCEMSNASSSNAKGEALSRRCQPRCHDPISDDVASLPRYSTRDFQAEVRPRFGVRRCPQWSTIVFTQPVKTRLSSSIAHHRPRTKVSAKVSFAEARRVEVRRWSDHPRGSGCPPRSRLQLSRGCQGVRSAPRPRPTNTRQGSIRQCPIDWES
jgi:hypothetical protein